MSVFFTVILIVLVGFSSCTTADVIRSDSSSIKDITPAKTVQQIPDAKDTASRNIVSEEKPLFLKLADYPLMPESREISLRVFPQDARISVFVNGKLEALTPGRKEKDQAWYNTRATALYVTAPEFRDSILPLDSDAVEAKLERIGLALEIIGERPTRYQPKSVRFGKNGETMYVAHLGDRIALSRYSTRPFEWIDDWKVPDSYAADGGFVETVILPKRRELWLSQMTRNAIHVFNLDTGVHKAAIPTSGQWPKVLIASEDESRVYASCWLSETVVEIDSETRLETRSIPVSGTPRGMVFSPDKSQLLVTIYSASSVDWINLDSGRMTATHDAAPGRAYAMRHIVYDETRREYYITAMGVSRVYRMSGNGEWLGSWQVGEKPNSCVMSPDGNRLFVSCRGPNNPDTGYLNRGYEYGKVYIIDLKKGEVEGWIWGRDQTTGLDVSPDGQYLAFTDFLSHNLELYRIMDVEASGRRD